MRLFHCSLVLFACVSLMLASCGKSATTSAPAPPSQPSATAKPKELIVGKWQRSEPGKEAEKLEFAPDGTISGGSEFKFKGKYKWLEEPDTLEYEVKPDVINWQYAKCKVKVSKDELTLDIVEAKSRADENAKWQTEADDRARIGQEKYKRQP